MTRIKVPGTDYEGMTDEQLRQSITGLKDTQAKSNNSFDRSRLQKTIDLCQSILDRRDRRSGAARI